jgi:hypothetical protein
VFVGVVVYAWRSEWVKTVRFVSDTAVVMDIDRISREASAGLEGGRAQSRLALVCCWHRAFCRRDVATGIGDLTADFDNGLSNNSVIECEDNAAGSTGIKELDDEFLKSRKCASPPESQKANLPFPPDQLLATT